MVPKSDPRDRIALAELVEEGRMLVPPVQTRSRQVLDREIKKHLGHLPAAHQPVMSDIGYHIREGKHDITEYDWQQYLAFAEKHFGAPK